MDDINLLRRIVWSFYYTTHVNIDDLFQEAALAYLKGMQSYDPKRGKISTHIWHCVTKHLVNYTKMELKHNAADLSTAHYATANTPTPFWHGLTADAQAIARTVLKTPNAFAWLNKADVYLRIKYIFTNKGWSSTRIQTAINELNAILSEDTANFFV